MHKKFGLFAILFLGLCIFGACENASDINQPGPTKPSEAITSTPANTSTSTPTNTSTPTPTITPTSTPTPLPEVSGKVLGSDDNYIEDALCQIEGDSINITLPYNLDKDALKKLKLELTAIGGNNVTATEKYALDFSLGQRDGGNIDFIFDDSLTFNYKVSASRKNYGVEVLEVFTENEAKITTTLTYVNSVMLLNNEGISAKIKGRGNSSWDMLPKKAYRLKFNDKTEVFGMNDNKDWVLVCNYVDGSLIRNAVACDIKNVFTNLTWAPDFRFTDLYLNDKYMGLYTINEKIEDAKSKINIGKTQYDENGNVTDMGFILEYGWDRGDGNNNTGDISGKDYFKDPFSRTVNIKEPEITKAYSKEYYYVENYYKNCIKAAKDLKGYEELIDVDAWIDWLLFNEFTFNTEDCFFRSLFVHKTVGGKLMPGPIWDYDTAFGNYIDDIPNYDGWIVKDGVIKGASGSNFIAYLLKDKAFQQKVKDRWREIRDELLEVSFASVKNRGEEIRIAQANNYAVWPEVFTDPRFTSTALISGTRTYDGQLDWLYWFLEKRFNWMDERLSSDTYMFY